MILYYIILYYITLYYNVLYYTILYYIILYYTICIYSRGPQLLALGERLTNPLLHTIMCVCVCVCVSDMCLCVFSLALNGLCVCVFSLFFPCFQRFVLLGFMSKLTNAACSVPN